jgi:hypothetical protein
LVDGRGGVIHNIIYFMHLGGPLEDDLTKTEISEYVIVHPSKSDPLLRPFWVAQVIDNDKTNQKLHVHWMQAPLKPKSSKKRAANGEDMVPIEGNNRFVLEEEPQNKMSINEEEAVDVFLGKLVPVMKKPGCKIPNYGFNSFIKKFDCNIIRSNSNTGKRKDVADTAWIEYDCVYFSFPMLRANGTLPMLVLKEIAAIPPLGWDFPPKFRPTSRR